jgi:hypothetical protein
VQRWAPARPAYHPAFKKAHFSGVGARDTAIASAESTPQLPVIQCELKKMKILPRSSAK